jgi:prephenate dehydrogenase
MAGSERKGMCHASHNLFDGAACFITPLDSDSDSEVVRLQNLWQAIGMRVVTTNPESTTKL